MTRTRFRTNSLLPLAAMGLVSLLLLSALAAQEGAFTIDSVEGEVLHIPEGKTPTPVKAGDAVVGGRLVTLDNAWTKVTFPGGKKCEVEPNSMIVLDPKLDKAEDSFAVTGGIRAEASFILPAENGLLPTGKPFRAVIAINTGSDSLIGVTTLKILARSADDGKTMELGEFPLPKAGKEAKGYRTVTVPVSQTPTVDGDYDLLLKTVQEPVGKEIGRKQPVVFGR